MLRRRNRGVDPGDSGGVTALVGNVLDALLDQIAVVDRDGVILAVNRAWRDFAAANGGPPATARWVGLNYLSVCGRATDESDDDASAAAAGIRAVLSGEASTFELEYPCHSPAQRRWRRSLAGPRSR